MGRLSERELTRLSYLMGSIVTSPQLTARLVTRVLRDTDVEWFKALLRTVAERIERAARGQPPTTSSLREAALSLIGDSDPEKQTVGRLLAAALESAPVAPVAQ